MEQESNLKGLETLGFDEYFREAASSYIQDDFSLARIIEVNKGNFKAADGTHEMQAELCGRFMFSTEDNTDFPTAGDWVIIQVLDNYSLAIIHNILPRKTLLKRKEPGKKIGFQLIASNIDYGLVVQSADSLNLNSLERYLVMLNESKIEPIVVRSKIDLLSASELIEIQNEMKKLSTRYVVSVLD